LSPSDSSRDSSKDKGSAGKHEDQQGLYDLEDDTLGDPEYAKEEEGENADFYE
jgi:hypothetical protein